MRKVVQYLNSQRSASKDLSLLANSVKNIEYILFPFGRRQPLNLTELGYDEYKLEPAIMNKLTSELRRQLDKQFVYPNTELSWDETYYTWPNYFLEAGVDNLYLFICSDNSYIVRYLLVDQKYQRVSGFIDWAASYRVGIDSIVVNQYESSLVIKDTGDVSSTIEMRT